MRGVHTNRSIAKVSFVTPKLHLSFSAAVSDIVCIFFYRGLFVGTPKDTLQTLVKNFCNGLFIGKDMCMDMVTKDFSQLYNFITHDLDVQFCTAANICHKSVEQQIFSIFNNINNKESNTYETLGRNQ